MLAALSVGLAPVACTPDFGEMSDDGAGSGSSGSGTGEGSTLPTTTSAPTGSTSGTSGPGEMTGTTAMDQTSSGPTTTATATVSSSSSTSDPEQTSSSSSTSGGSSSTSAGLECEPNELCAAEVPAGWAGPFALRTADAAAPEPECGGDYSVLEEAFSRDLIQGAHACSCDCGPAVGATCSTSTLLANGSNSAQCIFDINEWTISGSCDNAPSAPGGGWWSAEPFTVMGGACTPNPSETIEPSMYGERGVLCGAPPVPAGSCGDTGSCAAAPALPFESQLCVVADGDLECPADYPDKELFHAGMVDDRECSDCTCGNPFGTCSGYSVRLFNQANCGGSPLATLSPTGVCTEVLSNQGVESASIQNGTIENASCTPSGGVAVGSSVEAEPRTVCCGDFGPA